MSEGQMELLQPKAKIQPPPGPEKGLTKPQKRRARKKRAKAQRAAELDVAMPEPQPVALPELGIRFANDADAELLAGFYQDQYKGWDMDFSNPAPYWLLAIRGEEVVGAVQILYSKPVGMLEHIMSVEKHAKERLEIMLLLLLAGSEVLKQHGASVVAGLIHDDDTESWHNEVSKYGARVGGTGTIFMRRIADMGAEQAAKDLLTEAARSGSGAVR